MSFIGCVFPRWVTVAEGHGPSIYAIIHLLGWLFREFPTCKAGGRIQQYNLRYLILYWRSRTLLAHKDLENIWSQNFFYHPFHPYEPYCNISYFEKPSTGVNTHTFQNLCKNSWRLRPNLILPWLLTRTSSHDKNNIMIYVTKWLQ